MNYFAVKRGKSLARKCGIIIGRAPRRSFHRLPTPVVGIYSLERDIYPLRERGWEVLSSRAPRCRKFISFDWRCNVIPEVISSPKRRVSWAKIDKGSTDEKGPRFRALAQYKLMEKFPRDVGGLSCLQVNDKWRSPGVAANSREAIPLKRSLIPELFQARRLSVLNPKLGRRRRRRPSLAIIGSLFARKNGSGDIYIHPENSFRVRK